MDKIVQLIVMDENNHINWPVHPMKCPATSEDILFKPFVTTLIYPWGHGLATNT